MDWTSYFDALLVRISKSFGLSCRLATPIEVQEVGRFDEDSTLALTLLNGIPLYELGPIVVENHVWSGLLTSYLKAFRSLVSRFLSYASNKQNTPVLVPTVSLEVLSACERIRSFLFSGDFAK